MACASTWLAPATAQARKQTDTRYRYEQVWSASLRLVRVDLRYPVDDQDSEAGFVLFQYRDGDRSYPGSIELVRTEVDDAPCVRVVVQIPSMPSYIEQMLVDRLNRKLRDEFGEPPPARPRRPARPPNDDGSGAPDRREPDRDHGDDANAPRGDRGDRGGSDRDGDRSRSQRRPPRDR